jgi:hypothetical protein
VQQLDDLRGLRLGWSGQKRYQLQFPVPGQLLLQEVAAPTCASPIRLRCVWLVWVIFAVTFELESKRRDKQAGAIGCAFDNTQVPLDG